MDFHQFCIRLGLLLVLYAAGNICASPIIDLQPVTQSVASNTTVGFIVGVHQTGASPPLYVQWRRNGQNIPGATNIFPSGTGTSQLTITNVQPQDSGKYHALVFDSEGAIDSDIVSLVISNLPILKVTDDFSDRIALASFSGSASGNNIKATSEVGEPNIGGKPGGKSVWIKWIAPADGVAQFDTRGSDFDTTLSVFIRASSQSGYAVTNLATVAYDDDSGNYFDNFATLNVDGNPEYFNSSVVLNVAGDTEYEIGLDGFYGAGGNIVLNWSLDTNAYAAPQIVQPPLGVTTSSNASATFFLAVTNANLRGASLTGNFQWYHNADAMEGATNSTLTINPVKSSNLGEYRVLLTPHLANPFTLHFYRVFSQPVQLQIDQQGNIHSAADSKFHQAADPNFAPGLILPHAVPVGGFSGTHIWNTYGAESEPGEPNHCGKAGGAPYWFSYKAPTNGILTVDAYTPTFTNVMAIYTWGGGDFSTLNSVTCASTNNGVGHEVATFSAINGTNYYIVVDGLNGAVGNVTLNYSLTNLPMSPLITAQPQSQTVAQGSNVTLTVGAMGNPPPSYQWRTNTVKLQGQINATLNVTNFQSINEEKYDVIVTNVIGSITSSAAALYLNSPARFDGLSFSATGGFSAMLLGIANTNYIIQASTNLAKMNWISIATNNSPFGIISIMDTNIKTFPARYYRAVPR